MKQRLSSLDIKVLVEELRSSIIGLRLQNIYNVLSSDRIFQLKFSKPDKKKNLIIDYGFKFYLSSFERSLESMPSNFVTKLRKHLKSKRLTNLKQVDNDRIVVFEFSNGNYYLVLEFFSAGNLILLDSELKILSLQRVVHSKENDLDYSVNKTYPLNIDVAALFHDSVKYFNDDQSEEDNEDNVETPVQNSTKYLSKKYTEKDVLEWLKASIAKFDKPQDVANTKKSSRNAKPTLAKAIFLNISYMPVELIQKKMQENGLDPLQKLDESYADLENDEFVSKLTKAVNDCESYISTCLNDGAIEGVIVLKKSPNYDPNAAPVTNGTIELSTEYTYEQFHPFEPYVDPEKLASGELKLLKIKGYNETVDKFFSSLDLLKNSMKIEQSKNLLNKKLNNVKRDNLIKVDRLTYLEIENARKAELMIANADKIEKCKEAVQVLLDQSMDWKNIETLIKSEQSKNNEVAQMIVLPLNLAANKIKVRLLDNDEEENEDEENVKGEDSDFSLSDSDDETEPEHSKAQDKKKTNKKRNYVNVDIDLAKSVWANSENYFIQKKSAKVAKEKTEKTAKMALKNSERVINATIKKTIEKSNKSLIIRKTREKFWFEKFYWFFTSEDYLCIAPKDALQLEMIYYKFFNSKHDYFVSSDIEGSLKVFIKNPYKSEVPPSTLNQAGVFSLSASKAWSSKMVTSSWYVQGHQLTKLDPNDNETFLGDGRVDIIGEKNFLPPVQLTMGIALCWILNDEGKKLKSEKRLQKEKDAEMGIVEELADIKKEAKRKAELLKSAEKENENSDIASKPIKDKESAGKAPATDSDSASVSSEVSSATLNGKKKLTRGKKNKQKRLQQKYGDQDDEERELKLRALGVLKQVEQAKTTEQTDDKNGKSDLDNKSRKNMVPRKANRYNEQFLDILDEDLSLNDKNYLDILDMITHKINSFSEEIVDVIPMFAPWQSIAKFKYKAKIQPGPAKVGKSMNEILYYFSERKCNKESAVVKHGEKLDKTADAQFDFDFDFEFEHELVYQLKPVDFQSVVTVKGIKVVLPSNNGSGSSNSGSGGGKGNKNSGKGSKGGKKKK